MLDERAAMFENNDLCGVHVYDSDGGNHQCVSFFQSPIWEMPSTGRFYFVWLACVRPTLLGAGARFVLDGREQPPANLLETDLELLRGGFDLLYGGSPSTSMQGADHADNHFLDFRSRICGQSSVVASNFCCLWINRRCRRCCRSSGSLRTDRHSARLLSSAAAG